MHNPLAFDPDGAQLFPAVVRHALPDIEAALGELLPGRAGVRIHGNLRLRPHLSAHGSVGAVAASIMGDACHPVRAILFDKTPATNWALGWHQDRTIAVAARVEVDGFVPWTIKAGMIHVAPPFSVLAGMVTVRVHLDAVPAENAPLLIAPGSHRLGRIAESAVAGTVASCGVVACLAHAGDAWAYASPILHASEAASAPTRRRVLQIDYAVGGLPGGLEWSGV